MKFLIVATIGVVLGTAPGLPLFPSRVQCLDKYIQDAIEDLPYYTCAIFKPGQWNHYGSIHHTKTLHCGNYHFHRVCLVRGDAGSWLERLGDGGTINWRYDPSGFTREGARLKVKSRGTYIVG
ncbi:hypothetical protein DSO57_1014663 [Entomophthora muscae]|uniref:Uncharacterized protein n=1 Tax=Entomophthora muscae TaxID=34485 RepID=A0ACC2RWL6_9FUNG|nr:hypothetical protein DSO57_1014663 [Entomophthora muscae]